MIGKINISVTIYISMLLTISCGQKKVDVNEPAPIAITDEGHELQFERFEEELFGSTLPMDTSRVRYLREKYGDFFELWCIQLAGVLPGTKGRPSDAAIAGNLNQYLSDKYMKEVFEDAEKKFKDIRWLQEELQPVFQRYSRAFPDKKIPVIMTYLSPFTSNIMAMDTLLGIGLHFYLGSDYKYYPSLQLPLYMIKKMRQEYIINDMIKGWLDSEYMDDSAQNNCLSQMIYQGKVLYATDVLSPDIPDTIKTGYSEIQLQWALSHEEEIWSFFIEQQLLYNTNPKTYLKYIHDGNSTSGFPKEAPARLGAFIGWKMVRAYMKKHEGITLQQLFEMKDAQKILSESGYKPIKSNS
ncbi:MAG: hypothetical protein IPN36_17695 [Bacteroidetes bacterium]|nr:hypothetical protein [Bacteroidota bacterium]